MKAMAIYKLICFALSYAGIWMCLQAEAGFDQFASIAFTLFMLPLWIGGCRDSS